MKIKVNNVELYYEKYDTGKPIILLHENQESQNKLKKVHKYEFIKIFIQKKYCFKY